VGNPFDAIEGNQDIENVYKEENNEGHLIILIWNTLTLFSNRFRVKKSVLAWLVMRYPIYPIILVIRQT